MSSMIQWGMRQAAEVANQMTGVERVLEYTLLKPESNLRDKGYFSKKRKKLKALAEDNFAQVSENWPDSGCIEFENVYLKYGEDSSTVLKGLSLKIDAGEKVWTIFLFHLI